LTYKNPTCITWEYLQHLV